ncbi:MAG: DUF3368 domain-containing protein [Bacteroidia bacterium]
MIVVSDTTALSNLLQAGDLLLLERIYTRILIPQKVYAELMELALFGISVQEITTASWIEVEVVKSDELFQNLSEDLDEGEAEAIVLALRMKADYLLIDEKTGREIARKYNLKIIGTIGIYIKAKELGLIHNLKDKMDKLREIGFWISDRLYFETLKEVGEV